MSKKIANFRDLGGIPGADGKKIRYNMLFRGGHTAYLDAADGSLAARGVTTIADLRSPSELAEKPDVCPAGIEYRHIPPLDDEKNPSINKNNRMDVLERLMATEGGTRAHLTGIYRYMVSSESSLDAIRGVMSLLSEHRGGVLWHCTQGKDRTGVVTAAILLALGVDRKDIMRDYMRTNASCRAKNYLIFVGVTLAKLSLHTASSLHSLLSARREYMLAMFDEIDSRWGGTDGFLRDALRLSVGDIKKLRELYLCE